MNEFDIVERYHEYNRIANSDGFYESVIDLKQFFDIDIHEYLPDETMWYWKIPKRWHVNKAVLKDLSGNVIVDFNKNPLHLWAYSHSYSGIIERKDLIDNHIFSNQSFPNFTPFRFRQMVRHWESEWGFSLPHKRIQKLKDDKYQVEIDTYFTNDPMITFEYTSKGKSDDQILIVGHWCHHGIAEDGLSGCSVGIKAIDDLRKRDHYYTYTFLGGPEIIGPVAYLNKYANLSKKRIKAVLCLNFLGRNDFFVLYQSINNRSVLDQALAQSIKSFGKEYVKAPYKNIHERKIHPKDYKNTFIGSGSGDEAPFECPGVEIPTTALIRRTPYEVYHTDHDTPERLDQKNLKEATEIIVQAFQFLEKNWIPIADFKGLPCLSSPELQLFYDPPRISNMPNKEHQKMSDYILSTYKPEKGNVCLWNLSSHIVYHLQSGLSILDISEFFDLPFQFVNDHLLKWHEKKLVHYQKTWELEKIEKCTSNSNSVPH